MTWRMVLTFSTMINNLLNSNVVIAEFEVVKTMSGRLQIIDAMSRKIEWESLSFHKLFCLGLLWFSEYLIFFSFCK